MLNYNIKGTGLEVTDEIRDYVEKRLSKVEKFLHGDTTAHLDAECEYQTSEDRPKFRAELILSCKGQLHRSEAFGDTLHEAIDVAEADLWNDLEREKERSIDTDRAEAAKFKESVREAGE